MLLVIFDFMFKCTWPWHAYVYDLMYTREYMFIRTWPGMLICVA